MQAAASTAVAAFGKDGGKEHQKRFRELMEHLSGTSGSPDPGKKNLTEQIIKDRGRNGR